MQISTSTPTGLLLVSCKKSTKTNKGFLKKFLAQFGKPEGFWGIVAGKKMVYALSNRQRNAWTVSLLNIQPGDRVLEIGFGPGLGIEQIARITTKGFVAGIDHSDVMVRMASNRNAKAIREGRVELRPGSVSALQLFDQPFTKILAINTIQFWDNPVERLRELRRLLVPGGIIAITFQTRTRGATEETAQAMGQEIASALSQSGFDQVQVETLRIKPVAAVCVLGVKPSDV